MLLDLKSSTWKQHGEGGGLLGIFFLTALLSVTVAMPCVVAQG